MKVSGNQCTKNSLTSPASATRLPSLTFSKDTENTRESYATTFADIIFYDADQPNSGVDSKFQARGARSPLGSLIELKRGGAAPQFGGAAADMRLNIYAPDSGFSDQRSLLFILNQLIEKYLAKNSDPSGGVRIYTNLINGFVNGAASQSVSRGQESSFPDLYSSAATGTQVFGCRGDPKPNAVLFASLALILGRLSRDIDEKSRIADHLIPTLTDVPLYVKEAMRVNLPGFAKLFGLIVAKCEFLKQLMQKTAINLRRTAQRRKVSAVQLYDTKLPTGVIQYSDNNGAAVVTFDEKAAGGSDTLYTFDASDVASDAIRSRFAAILDGISNSAFALSSSSQEVLRELHDSPTYLQTMENGIEQYKLRYGKIPFMPLSLALLPLAMTNETLLMPDKASGSAEFKYLYGTRGLFMGATPVSIESMPGVKSIVDGYNATVTTQDKLESGRFAKFVSQVGNSLRFIVDMRLLRSQLTSVELFSEAVLNFGSTGSFALSKTALEAIEIVESSDQEGSVRKVSEGVPGGTPTAGAGDSRKVECILNLIDMNRMPFNFHSLMRTVPLANLINYSYTFDQMAANVMQVQLSSALDGKVRTSKGMFVHLLAKPFADITQRQYGSDAQNFKRDGDGLVQRIFRGDNNLAMGRPKFLSDQLYNKALLGSMYPAAGTFDEAGPGVGAGIFRGRAKALDVKTPGSGGSKINDGNLTYIKDKNLVVIDVAPNKRSLNDTGFERFNTRFVRKLFLIANVNRLLRAKLEHELVHSHSVIRRSHLAVAPSVTEYGYALAGGPNSSFAEVQYDDGDQKSTETD
jgi:hypothetical protein